MSFYTWGLTKGDMYMAVSRVPSAITAAFSFIQFWIPTFNLLEALGVLGFCCGFFAALVFISRTGSERKQKYMFYIGWTFFAIGYSIGLMLQARTFLLHGSEGAAIEYWLALLISSFMWTIYGYIKKDRWQTIFFGLGAILCIPIVLEIIKL